MTEGETSAKWHLRRSGGLGSRPRAAPGCFACRCVAADTWGKSNGLRPGQRPGGRRYSLPLSWAFRGWVLLPGAARGQDPERFRVSADHSASPERPKIVRVFEFMSLTSAPGRIRTYAQAPESVAVRGRDQRKLGPACPARGRTGTARRAWAAGCA
jgi:hypothetical protein